MKKRLLIVGIAACVLGYNAKAQLALETFDAAGIPAGWVMINDGHTVSSTFTGITTLPAALTANAFAKVNTTSTPTDSQMITTSLFAPAAAADRWLITPSFTVPTGNTVFVWQDYDLRSGESIEIKVSPTAGTTAGSFTSTIYSAPAATGGLTTHMVPLGTWVGTSIRVAFRDTTYNNWGFLVDNVKTDTVPYVDMSVVNLNIAPFVQTGSSHSLTGTMHNYGATAITSMNVNYSINGGAPVATSVTGANIVLGANYTYTLTPSWFPSTAGQYTVKIWASDLNGSLVDEVNSNDTVTAVISVIDTLKPKRVMIEEFTQASCDPCANAHVNVDTVYVNNMSRASLLRYHVNFPGRDMMNEVTQSPFVGTRLSYYGVSGVPDAQVDGQYVYPGAAGPGSLGTPVVAAAASFGSPFTITVTPSYVSATQTYSFTATITSQGAVPAGLKLYSALVEDTLTYALNQSTESIPQTVFPQVAENMFPTATLSAFTTGSTQTVSKSWTKNHPWGNSFSTWKYDSTATGKIIVWVENDGLTYFNNIKFVYQAAEASTMTSAHTAGVNTVAGANGTFNVFPNPARETATVSLDLKSASDVKMEISNAVGQVVLSMPLEHRNAGSSSSTINLANMPSGDYFVRVSINGELLNQTLSVIK